MINRALGSLVYGCLAASILLVGLMIYVIAKGPAGNTASDQQADNMIVTTAVMNQQTVNNNMLMTTLMATPVR